MAVLDTSLQQESRDRYLTYALSVVSGRALPDVRDGLKPVQRRILFAMFHNLRLSPNTGHRKSATVIGNVLGHYHPHGDSACYEAMVRMAQDFSLRYPLVDGQGNFGSLDGDNAAAYRYTEVRLREMAVDVMGEIDEETVDFRANFDGTVDEPVVLPSRVPNLLINGATGIAVGMATSIPPHNIRDTVKALLELSKDPEITIAKLSGIIKGPDFPTGCQILNSKKEITEIYQTGRGSVRMRAEWKEEDLGRGKKGVIVTTIPYAISKSVIVEKIANLIIERKVPQLVDVRDESTDIVRIVLELAPGADAEIAMAYLFRHTPLESSFPVNLTALVPIPGGATTRPELLSLKDFLQHFLNFREEVVQKRLTFERKKLLERIHILEGLVIIYDQLDVALKIVRSSDGRTDAATKLRAHFKLTEIQAFAVVDMRIYQLSRTNIEEIREELRLKQKRVKEIDAILKSKAKIVDIVRADLEKIEEKYGDKRRSSFPKEGVELEFNAEAYVVHEDVFAIVTQDGWIKRIRQGNEIHGTRIREGDVILRAHPLSTVDNVAFFTNFGALYTLKVADFPASGGYGSPIQKMLKFRDGEHIVESFGVKHGEGAAVEGYHYMLAEADEVVLISKEGMGFIFKVEGLAGIKRNGKRAMKLRDGDVLGGVALRRKTVAVFTQKASAVAVATKELPVRDSPAVGVTVMSVRDDDKVVGAVSYDKNVTVTLTLGSGKTKDISTKDIDVGHRALKGSKVVQRDEVKSVRIASPE